MNTYLFTEDKDGVIHDNSQKNWEIGVVANKEFECISFVNKNETSKGTHVGYISKKICRAISKKIETTKRLSLTSSKIKKKM